MDEKWSAEQLSTALLTSIELDERLGIISDVAAEQSSKAEALRFLGETIGRMMAVVDAVKQMQPGMVERLLQLLAVAEGTEKPMPEEVRVTSVDQSRAARMVLGQLQGDVPMLWAGFEEARRDEPGGSVSGRLFEVVLSLTSDLAEAHVFHAGTPAAAIAALQQHVAGLAADDTP